MNIDHTQIQLTPAQQAAIARHAELEGKDWTELIDERFPPLNELTAEQLQESLAMIDRGMAEIEDGQGEDAIEALKSLGKKHGFSVK